MPPTGSTFTDWQQIEAAERRLLMDEDFSWSEPPARSRRRAEEPPPARRRTAVAEREPDQLAYARDAQAQAQAAETHSEFDLLMQRWNEAYGDETRTGSSAAQDAADEHGAGSYDTDAFDYDDLARYTEAPVMEDRSGDYVYDSGRRTVVITGRGAERYPAARRRPSSDVRFHERAGFNPDRTAMWAVLLGLALLIGCVVH